MTFLIFLFIVSYVVQIWYSRRKFGYLLNPIVIFLIIFFLHNWSFSLTSLLNHELKWEVPIKEYQYRLETLQLNFSFLWAFFLTAMVTIKQRRKELQIRHNYSIYKYLYLFLAIISLALAIVTYGSTYGNEQALTAGDAFNPLAILFASRIIWAVVILTNSKSKKLTLIIIVIELLIAVLTGGRKSLIIILTCVLLNNYEYTIKRISFKKITFGLLSIFAMIYVSVFIIIFRHANHNLSFANKLSETNDSIFKNIEILIFTGLNSANSEGVQNWTNILIHKNDLSLTYGLSYLQAIVNTIVLRPYQGALVNYQAAYYFKNVAYPDISTQGYDFSFSAEAILNFGAFGFISYCMLALAISYIYNRRSRNDYYNTLYILFMSVLFITFRTDTTTLFRNLSFFIFSFFFLRIFSPKLLNRKYRNI